MKQEIVRSKFYLITISTINKPKVNICHAISMLL